MGISSSRPTTKINTALDMDEEQRILESRDTAMFVLSLFYWMLTKREAQGLRGDCHP